MSLPVSTSSDIEGTVSGKSAILRIDENNFKWSEGSKDDLASEWLHIGFQNIICVAPAPSQPPHEFSILYTIENEPAKDETKAFALSFRSLTTTGLPLSFVNKFRPAKTSCWARRGKADDAGSELHVVVSTGSGTGMAAAVWEQLVKPMLDYNGLREKEDYQLHVTTSEYTVTELTCDTFLSNANNGAALSILLLSGDGGIVDIVNTLHSRARTAEYRKPQVTLLPLGTGNALANSSGITGDQTLGLRAALQGSQTEVPCFRVRFSPGARLLVHQGQEERELNETSDGQPTICGAVVCSWGLHAGLVADSDTTEYRKFGSERFKIAAKEALFPSDGSEAHAYTGRVSMLRSGNREWEDMSRQEHGYVLATFMSHLEAGFQISPASKPLDGQLRLVHFAHMSGQEAMEIMTKAFQGGKHVEDDRLGYEEIDGLRVAFEEDDGRWRRVCVDGKIVRVEQGGWMEVHSHAGGVVDLVARKT